tara:strand:- start:320 stop:478 length:159 start_codon:yes stop_codon:yes gene_type:complete
MSEELKDKYIYICKKYEQLVSDYEGLRKYTEKLEEVHNECKETVEILVNRRG